VPGGAGLAEIGACGGDGRDPIGERDACVVDGRAGLERDAGREPTSSWIVFGDGARGQHGEDGIHGAGSEGADGMRGDRVGLRHIGEVPGGAGLTGIEACGGDGTDPIGERDTYVVDGRAGLERDASCQSHYYWVMCGHCI